jgi:endoglucanase
MIGIARRHVLTFGLLTAAGGLSRPALASPRQTAADRIAEYKAEWASFRQQYVVADGRVIDTWNRNISHSEGQGWGMLFAVAADDRTTFDLIRNWTRQNLQVRRSDKLHAWKFDPNTAMPTPDRNNASDGDLYIAWALARAAHRWNRPEDAAAACAIARDILQLNTRMHGSRLVLLPGAYGFEKPNETIVNPSYYSFAALEALNTVAPDARWVRLRADGLELLRAGRFGQWKLPPDWLAIRRDSPSPQTINCKPWAERPARFSYDACRVPLHLAWDSPACAAEPILEASASFWNSRRAAWTDLNTGALAPYQLNAGCRAISALALAAARGQPLPRVDLPRVREADTYYAAALVLLARSARRDASRRAAGLPPYLG